MSKTGFDIGGFRRPPVTREFLPHDDVKKGHGVTCQLNLDLLTLERMEQIEDDFNSLFDKPEPKQIEGESTAIEVAGKKPEQKEEVVEAFRLELYKIEKAMCRFRAMQLGGKPGDDDPESRFVRSWNVERDGKPLPVSFEAIMAMPTAMIEKFYNWVTGEASNPTKDEKKA